MRTALVTVGALMLLGTVVTTPAPGSVDATSTVPPSPGDPIPLSDVEGISIDGIGRAMVTIGSPAELTVAGPIDAVEQLVVDVQDGELTIEPGPETTIELAAGEELVYEIVVESLTDIRVRDSVSLQIDGIRGADLGVELADTATASVLDVDLEELQVGVQGTAVIRVTGSTDDLEIDARESGAVDGTDLAAGTASVDAREAARVVVNVTATLEAEVRDSAVVEHVGTPGQTELDVRDAGQVRAATGTLIPVPADAGAVTASATAPGTTSDTGPSTAPISLEVSLAGRAFSPAVLEVAVGDTVTWINDDDTEHTVTAFEGAFDSGELATGASFSFTFDTAGEFRYRCLFHSEMQGTIIVR
jgi:plastocyanin